MVLFISYVQILYLGHVKAQKGVDTPESHQVWHMGGSQWSL